MEIRCLDAGFFDAVYNHVATEWGEPVISRGRAYNVRDLSGFAAVACEELLGAVLYDVDGDELEIVVLFSNTMNKGVGSSLISAVINLARRKECKRVFLITMNDNTHAIRFYQKRGFELKAVHINAFDVTRKMKKEPLPAIVYGIDGIPVKHEFEFEIVL